MQTQHPVATGGEVHVVRDQHQGRAGFAVQLEQQAAYRFGRVVVQVAGRLVGQQQPGPVHQRAGNRHALLLAAGELARVVVQPGPEPDPPQQHLGTGVGIGLVRQLQRQRDVVERAQAGQQVKGLEHDADGGAPQVGPAVGVERGQVGAGHADMARCRLLQPRQQQQQ
jgi:hypothetical protein